MNRFADFVIQFFTEAGDPSSVALFIEAATTCKANGCRCPFVSDQPLRRVETVLIAKIVKALQAELARRAEYAMKIWHCRPASQLTKADKISCRAMSISAPWKHARSAFARFPLTIRQKPRSNLKAGAGIEPARIT